MTAGFVKTWDVQLINSERIGTQIAPSVQTLTGGLSVTTWHSRDSATGIMRVKAQILDGVGLPVGGEFQVNTTVGTLNISNPDIVMLANGNFVISWVNYENTNLVRTGLAQIFDASGSPVGGEIRLDVMARLTSDTASLTALVGGGFLATWTHYATNGVGDIRARYFSEVGVPLTDVFGVAVSAPYSQKVPMSAELTDGSVVIVWQQFEAGVEYYNIYSQRFDELGQAISEAAVVNTFNSTAQVRPSVTPLKGGGYVVIWQSDGQDGGRNGIYGQRFSAAGQAQGLEFLVNTVTYWDQKFPEVTALSDGGFLVVWQASDTDPDRRVFAQRYDEDGSKVGVGYLIESFAWTFSNQYAPTVSALDEGGFVVSWVVGLRGENAQDILTQSFSPSIRGTGFDDADVGTLLADWYVGGAGDDFFIGRIGDDVIEGGSGNDLLRGGKGDDILLGGTGVDRLKGNIGNDILHGNDGSDFLKGQNGDDILLGGQGMDALRGGAGADTFVFTRVSDSTLTMNDRIMDFEVGIDKIDLSAVISGSFNFIGDALFSGTDTDIRAISKAGKTILRIDVDGDGVADMKIYVAGDIAFTESDFIL